MRIAKLSFTFISLVSLLLGASLLVLVLFDLQLSQGLCQEGFSPQPIQGCSYIPYLNLDVYGEYYVLLAGTLLILVGFVSFVAFLVSQDRIDSVKLSQKRNTTN